MSNIHPTAIISPDAQIGNNVTIGAYTIIEEDCVIGDECVIDAHVKIGKHTAIGARTRIYFGAVIGDDPQDHRFKPGTYAQTKIGSDAVLREYVTIHRSPFENGITEIGDGTLLMAFVHIGHDAVVGRKVTIANNTALAGHVQVGDGAVISAYVLAHQFCRIGSLAMIGGRTLVRQDVPPFCMLAENNFVCGPNVVGLRRAGFDDARRLKIRKIIKDYFFRRLNGSNALERINSNYPDDEDAIFFSEFIKSTTRGIIPGDPAYVHAASLEIDNGESE